MVFLRAPNASTLCGPFLTPANLGGPRLLDVEVPRSDQGRMHAAVMDLLESVLTLQEQLVSEHRTRFAELLNSGLCDDTVPHEIRRIEGPSGSSPNRSGEQTIVQDEETDGEEFSQVELEMKDRRVVIKQQVLTSRSPSDPHVVHRGSTGILSRVKNRLLSSGKSKGWVAWLVETRAFTLITTCLIVVNALFVGIVADSEMRAAIADYHGEVRHDLFSDDFVHYVSMFFTFAVALELVLRVVHMRWFFIFEAGHHWNFLDVLFVTAGILEIVDEGGGLFDVNYLRGLRLLRLLRAATLLRSEPIFSRLRLMLLALGGCLHSLLWVVVLLSFSMYLFAVDANCCVLELFTCNLNTLSPMMACGVVAVPSSCVADSVGTTSSGDIRDGCDVPGVLVHGVPQAGHASPATVLESSVDDRRGGDPLADSALLGYCLGVYVERNGSHWYSW